MQPISRALRMAAFTFLALLILPTSAQTQQAAAFWEATCVPYNPSGGREYSYTAGGFAFPNDTLFMVRGPTLCAFDASTGDFKWHTTADVTNGLGTGTTPVIAKDMALTIMGQVIAWNASSSA
jgi:hypothetical protein